MPCFRVVFHPAACRRLLEDVEADDLRTEGAFLVFRRDILVLRRPRTVVTLRVARALVSRVDRDQGVRCCTSDGTGPGS